MGVKGLWNILTPICDRKPLYELQGKIIAIDLSCWIVDSQTITDNVVQPKMYLRNLFFRTSFLLMNNITPVFVLEGEAPVLKHKTITKRNLSRFGREFQRTGRRQFKKILNQCETMLACMGLTCIQGIGEAEAMCAHLNANQIVDGCISQDSDCFLYGAKKVYKNFSMSVHKSSGTVDEYDMERIGRDLKLGRNKMIVMALLCGCDYDNGVNGVGKESVMKFFQLVEDDVILKRINNWKNNSKYEELESNLSNLDLCTSCGHYGKLLEHTKSGCVDCSTKIKCDDSYKNERARLLNEILIRKKALLSHNFPNSELIDEYLKYEYPIPDNLQLQWKRPDMRKFVHFMEKHLTWDTQYSFAKLFPLATRWQLLNLTKTNDLSNLFVPEKIRKKRNIRGVMHYEIVWVNNDESIEKMITIEPQNLIKKCYEHLVEEFIHSKCEQKPKIKKIVIHKPLRNLNDKKMDEFLNEDILDKSFKRITISPHKSKQATKADNNSGNNIFNNLDVDDCPSDLENDGIDMSMVVNRICNKKSCEEIDIEQYVPIDVRIQRLK